MVIVKYISIILIFITAFLIGYFISKKYSNRVLELKELETGLNILKNKIKFTYEPLKEIFYQTASLLKGDISNIFNEISIQIEENNIQDAWKNAVNIVKTNLEKEDIKVVENLFKILGKTEKEGQVSQIELTETFVKTQIHKAEVEEEKNAKLYKTLGATVGMALVIILI